MSIWAQIEHMLATVLPGDCLLCGADTAGPAPTPMPRQVCPACVASLPRLAAEACPQCALPTPGGAVCGACLRHPPYFDATQAVWAYAFPTDQLILALKYGRRLASADFLGAALAALPGGTRPDLILPVPLSAARLAERGFNQSVEIARPLAWALGLPLERHGVHRTRDTTPQAGLPWKARAKNIRHAFESRLDLSGRSVLVVDDVMTTGATLNELARVLKAHGAVRVENRVVARALRD